MIEICKESGVDVTARGNEECHRFPLSRNRRGYNKKVTFKFVNQKYVEAQLQDKKQISVTTSRIYMSLTKFFYLPPFAHTMMNRGNKSAS